MQTTEPEGTEEVQQTEDVEQTASTGPFVPYARLEELARQNQYFKDELERKERVETERLRSVTEQPPPPEVEREPWLDDRAKAEYAAHSKKIRDLEAKLEQSNQILYQRGVKDAIEREIAKHDFLDRDYTAEQIAKDYYAAQTTGQQFDAASSVKRRKTEEDALLSKARQGYVQKKQDTAAATASIQPGSTVRTPADELPAERPQYGTQERKAYDKERKAHWLSQMRLK